MGWRPTNRGRRMGEAAPCVPSFLTVWPGGTCPVTGAASSCLLLLAKSCTTHLPPAQLASLVSNHQPRLATPRPHPFSTPANSPFNPICFALLNTLNVLESNLSSSSTHSHLGQFNFLKSKTSPWQCLAMFGNAWQCLAMLGNTWQCLAMLGLPKPGCNPSQTSGDSFDHWKGTSASVGRGRQYFKRKLGLSQRRRNFRGKKDREMSCMRWHILAFGGAFTEQTSECLLDLAWVADTTNTKSTAINTTTTTTVNGHCDLG